MFLLFWCGLDEEFGAFLEIIARNVCVCVCEVWIELKVYVLERENEGKQGGEEGFVSKDWVNWWGPMKPSVIAKLSFVFCFVVELINLI